MHYADLKDRTTRLQHEERELRSAGTREWLCPDRSLIRVTVAPQFAPDEIQLSFSRFVECEGAHSKWSEGRWQISGGYHDHVHDALRFLTVQQLEYVREARRVCERYVAGELESLPLVLF